MNIFAAHFKTKISSFVQRSILNANVNYGTRKLFIRDENFMAERNVPEAVMYVKLKNSERFDRIPLKNSCS